MLSSMILLAISLGGQAAQGATISLTDVLGRKVTVPAPAQRVLLGFYFEDFLAITGPGAYDRVVAISRSAWHDWRNSQWKTYVKVIPRIQQLIDVGEVDAGTFNLEKAIAAKPDVAILAAWQFRALGNTVNKLEAAGIPVVVVDYNAQTVAKHVASTLIIGKIMGSEDRARKLADNYAAAVAEVQKRVASAGIPAKRVYVELGNKGPGEYGNTYPDWMWGAMIGLAGGNNIAFGKVGRSSPLNPEFVLAANPQAIFIAGSYWVKKPKALVMGFGVDVAQTRKRLAAFTQRPGWSQLDAVKNKAVYGLYHGGARTLYDYTFLQFIAKALYPKAFADIDPVANHRRYYEQWLPVKAEGAFMVSLKDH